MNICSLDWDIAYKYFQTILTVLIAGSVYFLWHKQKGKEVISNEAKEIFKLLEQASSKSHQIFEQMLIMATQGKVPNDFDKEILIEFRNMNVEILKRLDFIRYKNTNKNTLSLIDTFSESYADFMMHYFRNDNMDLEQMMSDENRYRDIISDLRKDMYEYALYKKIL